MDARRDSYMEPSIELIFINFIDCIADASPLDPYHPDNPDPEEWD